VQLLGVSTLKDLLKIYCSSSEVLGLKGLKPSAAARNHNSEAGKNTAFSLQTVYIFPKPAKISFIRHSGRGQLQMHIGSFQGEGMQYLSK